MIIIRRHHCSQWKRYASKFGELAISRRVSKIAFIPRHTPMISIDLDRVKAAECLRTWRKHR
jgi:hypothetical protein